MANEEVIVGIPRKRSRKLTTESGNFVYLVKRSHEMNHEKWLENRVTVQADVEKPGRVLQFVVPFGSEVTPETVRKTIEEAKSRGWDPTVPGAAFVLG